MRFQVADNFDDDPAVLKAGTAAVGAYFRCGVYSARHLLDGFVPSEVVARYSTPEWSQRLVDVGLWEPKGGGYWMPRYLDDNLSREQILARRRQNRVRQERWLQKQRAQTRAQTRAAASSTLPRRDTCRVHGQQLPCLGCASEAKVAAGP